MTTHPETAFAFPRTLSVDDMQDSLAARFGIRTVPLPTERATYYDTFDRRLGRKGGALGHRRLDADNHLCWENGTLEIEQPTPSKKPPSFAQDLPQGPVRDVVAPLIKMRRLLPLIELERERQTLELLDDDEKIVVRLRLETSRAREPGSAQPWVDLPSVLRVRPVRGYDPERAALIAMLDAIPDLHPARGGAREVALDALGYSTPADPSELHVELSYNVRADVGLRRVHGALLDIMLANEHGLREAVDTEFLHDFRVAVRRTRALLSEVKHVFPEALVNHYKAEFAWLGGATNTTRDLDVFLLHLEDYEAELEGADLSALRKTLQKHWSRERRKLLAELDSPRFATLCDGWRAFLEDGETGVPVPRKASLPLGEVVSSRIWRVYRKTDQRSGSGRDQTGATPVRAAPDPPGLQEDALPHRLLPDGLRPGRHRGHPEGAAPPAEHPGRLQ